MSRGRKAYAPDLIPSLSNGDAVSLEPFARPFIWLEVGGPLASEGAAGPPTYLSHSPSIPIVTRRSSRSVSISRRM